MHKSDTLLSLPRRVDGGWSAALNRKLAEKVAQASVLRDVVGDTLEMPGTAALKAKGTAPRKIVRAKKARRSVQRG